VELVFQRVPGVTRTEVRGRLHRRHGTQRGRPRPVRPRRLQVRRPARRLLGQARPHHAQSPGAS
jgi:hypothetical protein